jgi:hypothetical protein
MPATYSTVNASWPDVIPELTQAEAITATKRLWRKFTGRTFKRKFRFVTGNRWTRGVPGMIYNINLKGHAEWPGWKLLVHSLSHRAHSVQFPNVRPHAGSHAFLEREMIAYVVASGWLDGKLKRPERAKPDARAVKRERILARIKVWEAKQARAQRALRKLERQRRYYETVSMPAEATA